MISITLSLREKFKKIGWESIRAIKNMFKLKLIN